MHVESLSHEGCKEKGQRSLQRPIQKNSVGLGTTYRVFHKKVPTFVLLISQLPKHFEKWFCTFFNSPSCAESKIFEIYILRLKLVNAVTKV